MMLHHNDQIRPFFDMVPDFLSHFNTSGDRKRSVLVKRNRFAPPIRQFTNYSDTK